MTDFNKRLSNDIINHAMNRIGTILSDSVDILPDQEAVIQLYATVLAQAMAALTHGLASENHPLFAKLRPAHRCSVLSTHVAHALDPDDSKGLLTSKQDLSDLFAASREIGKHFNFRVILDDAD